MTEDVAILSALNILMDFIHPQKSVRFLSILLYVLHLPIIQLQLYQNVFGGLIPRLNLIKRTKCRSLG